MKERWIRASGQFILESVFTLKMARVYVVQYSPKPECTSTISESALPVTSPLAIVTMAAKRLTVLLTVIDVSFSERSRALMTA